MEGCQLRQSHPTSTTTQRDKARSGFLTFVKQMTHLDLIPVGWVQAGLTESVGKLYLNFYSSMRCFAEFYGPR
jgi:hypothetical protein